MNEPKENKAEALARSLHKAFLRRGMIAGAEDIPSSFCKGLADAIEGRVVDLDIATSLPPSTPAEDWEMRAADEALLDQFKDEKP